MLAAADVQQDSAAGHSDWVNDSDISVFSFFSVLVFIV